MPLSDKRFWQCHSFKDKIKEFLLKGFIDKLLEVDKIKSFVNVQN